MRAPPEGWPRITPGIFYDDAAGAIDWLCRVFGFDIRLKVEGDGGVIVHSELEFGEGLVMVGSTSRGESRRSPRAIGGGGTQHLMVFVDAVDAHCERARAAGARIITEPETNDYGEDYWSDRLYEAEDCEGHRWWFVERVRTAQKK